MSYQMNENIGTYDVDRYPIGPFCPPETISTAGIKQEIEQIERVPRLLVEAVAGLSDSQLDTEYRVSGWTIRQVVHHLADSHLNSYCRFKLAVTENTPTIKTYEEARWAELVDGKTAVVDISLQLLSALHARWVMFLRSLNETDWKREVLHPELGQVTIGYLLYLYSWHGRHHIAHITGLRNRKGWN